MAFVAAISLRPSIVSRTQAAHKSYSSRALRMTVARGETLKNCIRTGTVIVGTVIAINLGRTPTFAASTPPAQFRLTPQSLSLSPSSPSTSYRAILVSKTIITDATSIQSTDDTQTHISHASTAILTDAEFTLSIRLCAACTVAVYIVAMSSNLREVAVASVASCFSTVYSLVRAGLESTAIATIAPSLYTPFFVGFGSLLFSLVYFAVQSLVAFNSARLRRRLISKSGLIASAAGASSACATGQALPAIAFYLLALAMCKIRDRTRTKYGTSTISISRRKAQRQVGMVSIHAMIRQSHSPSPTKR